MNSVSKPGEQQSNNMAVRSSIGESDAVHRLQSRELFAQAREIEIDHGGRIYKLRITQQNKLILTA